MLTIPGIQLATGRPRLALPGENPQPSSMASSERQFVSARLGDWLSARVDSRYEPRYTKASSEVGVTVLFEGYLTAVQGYALPLDTPAATICALFLESGIDFLTRLRGSYSCLIMDNRNNKAHLFNDRRASRPLFYRQNSDSSLLVAPEVFFLAAAEPPLVNIDPVAICEFVLFASYYNDRTLFPSIRKLPPASIMIIGPDSLVLRRYWEILVDPDKPPRDEDACVEQALALFDQSVCRSLVARPSPCLLLSGGIDSRMIFSSLRRAGYRIPAVTYGTEEGDDAQISQLIAERYGLPFTFYPIDTVDPQRFFANAALRSDCRAEMVDTPTQGMLFDDLATRFGSFLHGDKCFYGKDAKTAEQALASVDVISFSNALRLGDMLDPLILQQVRAEIEQIKHDIVAGAGKIDPLDLKDKIYFEQRLVNRQNAFAGANLRQLEQVRPWLDEDLVEFLFAIPGSVRRDKYINRKMLESADPDLARIPFASRDSIPQARTYRKDIPANPALAEFIHTQFNELLDPRLEALFRQGSLTGFAASLESGAPFPLRSSIWWHNLPGMWRMTAKRYSADRIHPVSIMLRLMQINLYLNALSGYTASIASGKEGRV